MSTQSVESIDQDIHSEPMVLQMGPSHPATHGTVRFTLTLDGETVIKCDTEVGYLHRGFEKEAENSTWTQVFPYTDRLNYLSPLLCNFSYAMGVEKLLELEVPPRGNYVRTIMGELSRLSDHYTCVGAGALELGAMTACLEVLLERQGRAEQGVGVEKRVSTLRHTEPPQLVAAGSVERGVARLQRREHAVGAAEPVRLEMLGDRRREVLEQRLVASRREAVARNAENAARLPEANLVGCVPERDHAGGPAERSLLGPAQPHVEMLGERDDVAGRIGERREREPVDVTGTQAGALEAVGDRLEEVPERPVAVLLLVRARAVGDEQRIGHGAAV